MALSRLPTYGDTIGNRYRILNILGRGGLGIVYLVHDQQAHALFAMKTFLDERYLGAEAALAFEREARLWLDMARHPCVIPAYWVECIEDRCYVVMPHVSSDDDRTSLQDYLADGRPMEFTQVCTWAVQFCNGMEHAVANGLKAHRDIKPENVLIDHDILRIADFGLATAVEAMTPEPINDLFTISGSRRPGLGLFVSGVRTICGTPGYIAPEVYVGRTADERSDIYSFGLMLWQMAIGSTGPPFAPCFAGDVRQYAEDVYALQVAEPAPRVGPPLVCVVDRCLQLDPARRFGSFKELRSAFEDIHRRETGQDVTLPEMPESERWAIGVNHGEMIGMGFADPVEQETFFFINRGRSIGALGDACGAISMFDRALTMNPYSAQAWHGKAVALEKLGRKSEAEACLCRAEDLEPTNGDEQASGTMGLGWRAHNSFDETVWGALDAFITSRSRAEDFDGVVVSDPDTIRAFNSQFGDEDRCRDLLTKANNLCSQGRPDEALACFDEILRIRPWDSAVLYAKAELMISLGRKEEALHCANSIVDLDPGDPGNWRAAAQLFLRTECYPNAIELYRGALELAPDDLEALTNLGFALGCLLRVDESVDCFDKVIALAPDEAAGWLGKGNTLILAKRTAEAADCILQGLRIRPDSWQSLTNLAQASHALTRDEQLAIRERMRDIYEPSAFDQGVLRERDDL